MDPVRSNNGPRYKHLAEETAEYDTITVDKLTPIIGGEIGGDLVDDVLVASRLELGGNHLPCIGFGFWAGHPHPLRRPEPQQPVAPGGGLEAELLIVLEPGLELFLSVGKGGHSPLTLSDAAKRRCIPVY